MANTIAMRYAVSNLITESTLDSVSSEDTLYVKEYLYDERQSKPFRWTSNTAEWILIDLGSDIPVRFVSLLLHDFVNPGTLQMQGYLQATGKPTDCSDPADFTETLSLCPENDNIFKRFAASVTCRYWLLCVTDVSAPANMGLGQLFMATDGTQFTRNYDWGFSERLVIVSANQQTGYGQTWASHKAEYMEFEISFSGIEDDDIEGEWLTFIKAVKKNVPFIYVPDDSDDKCWYVLNMSDWDLNREFIDLTNFSLELREQSRGIAVL